jgi:peptide subunit release factor 1 (eRF1)
MSPTQPEYGATGHLDKESASPYHLHEGQNEREGRSALTSQTQPLNAAEQDPASPHHLQEGQNEQEGQHNANESLDDEYEMSLTELLYSSSSYHAIVKPGTNEC